MVESIFLSKFKITLCKSIGYINLIFCCIASVLFHCFQSLSIVGQKFYPLRAPWVAYWSVSLTSKPVRVSLGAPFIWPCATSKQKLVNYHKFSTLIQRYFTQFFNGFKHKFFIFLPQTTKTTLQDITYQISGKMAKINWSYNKK